MSFSKYSFIDTNHIIEPTDRSVQTLLEHPQNFIRTLIVYLLAWAIIALRKEAEKKVPRAECRGRKSCTEKSSILLSWKHLKDLFYKSFHTWGNDKTIQKHGIIFFNCTINTLLHKYRTQYVRGSLVALL